MTLSNSHRVHFAIHYETTPGEILANAAAYASDEGTDTIRYFIEPFDPSFIRGPAAVANADQMTRVGQTKVPHKGLETADGGSITMRMWGNGGAFSAGAQTTESAIDRLLAHCLGGVSYGNDTEVSAVTSQTVLEVAAATNLAIGQIIFIEDADDLGRLHPAQILVISGSTITIDRVMSFTVAIGDNIYGAASVYYDQDALTNPESVSYSTVSIISCHGSSAWLAVGGHLALESIALERGQQPKLSIPVLAAKGLPPGATGGIAVPTWTGTIQGLTDVKPIGRDTMARVATYGATTTSNVRLFSAALQVGCPVLAQDGVTESVSGMPGRIGYRTEPAETLLTLVVDFSTDEYTRWTAGTLLTVSYYQVDSVGRAWCVHGRKGFLNDSPKPMTTDVNKHELVIRFTDDTASTATTELAASKLIIAFG